MSNVNRFSVTSTRKTNNGDFPETAALELEKLAVFLTKLPGTTHRSTLCMHIICLQSMKLYCDSCVNNTAGYEVLLEMLQR